MGPIDVVIPAHPKDGPVLRHAVRGVLRHVVDLGRVFVVSGTPFRVGDDRVVWVPEPTLPSLPSLDDVRGRWLAQRPETADRAAWVYQQLLKLGAASYIDGLSKAYLAMDADVIFMRPTWLAGDGARFPYTRATEYHQPYREAYRRLLGSPPASGHSFVTHQMLFDRELVSELQREIEELHGIPWYWAFVDATSFDHGAPISEWETYGHWMLDRHPEHMEMQQLSWRNVATVPWPMGRAILGKDYHFVAAHHHARTSRWTQVGRVCLVITYNVYAMTSRRAPRFLQFLRTARRSLPWR
jgi:hypothetical protein